jgi:hypothetical protein
VRPPSSSRARPRAGPRSVGWRAPGGRAPRRPSTSTPPTAAPPRLDRSGARSRRRRTDHLTLIYESPSTSVLLKPDNITVSPGGGILLCEDTDRARQTFLRGVTGDGQLYDFAANIRPGTIPGSTTPASWDEFAGATFKGGWLFVNIQTPGVTFAITGPWESGPLV